MARMARSFAIVVLAYIAALVVAGGVVAVVEGELWLRLLAGDLAATAVALAADPVGWWRIVGPLGITILFIAISIPLLDRRSVARRPGYREHMARVPALVPRPWRTVRRYQVADSTIDPIKPGGPGSVE
jgi:hypothetical protein